MCVCLCACVDVCKYGVATCQKRENEMLLRGLYLTGRYKAKIVIGS